MNWSDLRHRSERIAGWMIDEAGVAAGDTIAIISEESLHWLEVSMAIQAACAVELPRETTISTDELRELQQEFHFSVAFFQTRDLAVRHADCPLKRRIVLEGLGGDWGSSVDDLEPGDTFDRSSIAERNTAARGDSIAAVIRTSGTTGDPKLVPLSHQSLLHMMSTLAERARLTAQDRILSILPPWHLYARLVQYAALEAGCEVAYGSPEDLAALPGRVRPTIFPGFPEIWEAIYHRIVEEFTARGLLGRPFFWFLSLSQKYRRALDCVLGRERYLRPTPVLVRAFRWAAMSIWLTALPVVWLADVLLFRRIRAALGGRLRIAIVGDAPLPMAIDEALRAIGFSVLEGYGSTEQCVTVMRSPKRNVTGTTGRPLPETSLLIVDQNDFPLPPGHIGEIVVSGPQVFAGYAGKGTHAERCFLSIGGQRFYRTGDLGCLDFHANVCVFGRLQNAFHLPNGDQIIPELMEGALRGHRSIDRVVVIGRGLAAPVALVVPNVRELYLEIKGRTGHRHRSLVQLPTRAVIKRVLSDGLLDGHFRTPAQTDLPWSSGPPARVVLLSHAFRSPDEITPTLKPRRHAIEANYAGLAARALAQEAFVSADFNIS